MNLTLHHINLCTDNVEEMDNFYQDILGLDRET
ncbi:MAG: VOC family protein, partial [Alphaproteobacteria bacterium]|nr:VOC family protein [Alphaproteobacteria bacterium]